MYESFTDVYARVLRNSGKQNTEEPEHSPILYRSTYLDEIRAAFTVQDALAIYDTTQALRLSANSSLQ